MALLSQARKSECCLAHNIHLWDQSTYQISASFLQCMMHDAWCNTLVDLKFVRTVSIPNLSLLPCLEWPKFFFGQTDWRNWLTDLRTKPYIEAACCLKMFESQWQDLCLSPLINTIRQLLIREGVKNIQPDFSAWRVLHFVRQFGWGEIWIPDKKYYLQPCAHLYHHPFISSSNPLMDQILMKIQFLLLGHAVSSLCLSVRRHC